MIKILGQIENNCLPDVVTERLYLRQRTVGDAADIYAYARFGDVTYPAGFAPMASLADEVAYIETHYPQHLQAQNLPSGYGITLKGSDTVIGSVDFNHRIADDVLEMGYLLHPDYWGQGLVPEAGQALLEVGFTLLGLHKIEIQCYDHNEASQAVARKLGFTLEGTQRGIKDVRGQRCANLRYGLLRSEWEARRVY